MKTSLLAALKSVKPFITAFILVCCTGLLSTHSFAQCTPVGDPSVFGDNVWNIYAWNSGGTSINGNAWNINYAGYYTEPSVSFATRDRWNVSPSSASGYVGCAVTPDNHSWSAKRQGFPCGHYAIDIPYHVSAAQLFVDGVNVWEHNACCDAHDNVWEGDLGANSKVEFRATVGSGISSVGMITFTKAAIIANGTSISCSGNVSLSSNFASGNQWYKDGVAIDGATEPTCVATVAGTYTVQVNNSTCASDPVTVTSTAPPGDPSVFGDGVWNVYVWNEGDGTLAGNAWNNNYSGFYTDTGFYYVNGQVQSFDFGTKWSAATAPSYADTYSGCAVGVDNHSWSAKRQGFPPGFYNIDINYHDDAAQLFINGQNVWEHDGCCDYHPSVWYGYLTPSDQVEFRCTEGAEESQAYMSMSFTPLTITANGNSTYCTGSVMLSSNAPSGNQWYKDGVPIDGATEPNYVATVAGNYTVKLNDGTTSAPVTVTSNAPPGDPSVFGNGVWNVYVWNEGDGTLAGNAWSNNYSGYYTDSGYYYTDGFVDNYSFNTQDKWSAVIAPSYADTYHGCPVGVDNHSWSAKRKGFPRGFYTININYHDDAAQLFINGQNVWGHDGCCDYHDAVWQGCLGPHDQVEFRVTEGAQESQASISIYGQPLPTPSAEAFNITPCSARLRITNYPTSGRGFAWYKVGVATRISTSSSPTVSSDGDYYVIVSFFECSSEPSNIVHVALPSKGDPSVFGDNKWNVYTFQSSQYRGYYSESSVSFNTQDRWDASSSPSSAPGYIGCPVSPDFFNFSAKRKGFPCGHYKINIPGHDDDIFLYINGVKVFEHYGCCDSHDDVWEGDLGSNTEVEVDVTEVYSTAFAAIDFELINAEIVPKPTITPGGPTDICSLDNLTLTSSAETGNVWSTGETLKSITVNSAASYFVTVTGSEGCTAQSDAVDVTVTQAQTWYPDADGDGYGDPAVYIVFCGDAPTGWVSDNTDCNDNDASVHAPVQYYVDADHDGFGSTATEMLCSSTAPVGYSTNNTDCNDGNAGINPNTVWYLDADNDGYYSGSGIKSCSSPGPGYKYTSLTGGGDCNDANALINPATVWYKDADNDGYYMGTGIVSCTSPGKTYKYTGLSGGGDCNDNDNTIHPNATELCGDGKDNNCNGQIDEGCSLPSVSIASASKTEGNKGQSNIVFTVSLDKTSTKKVTVSYATQNGSATAGSDYSAKSGTVSIAAGSLTATVSVPINGDKTIEPNETFTVTLSSPVNASLGSSVATGTVLNDDGAVAPVAAITLTDNRHSIKVMPNPVSSIVKINLEGYSGDVTIKLSNSEGKLLKEEKLIALDMFTQKQMDVSKYASGVYFITAIDEKGNRQTERVVVAH